MIVRSTLVAAALVTLCVSSAPGAPLNLTPSVTPNIFSGAIDVAYDAGTGQFTALGYPMTACTGYDPQADIEDGWFDLRAVIGATGQAESTSLTITGQTLGSGPDLLSANLVDFGYGFYDTQNGDCDTAIFEWRLSVTGGDLAQVYGGNGAIVGVILTACVPGHVSTNAFGADFDNVWGLAGSGTAISDVGPIPGDANRDGLVDMTDLNSVFNELGQAGRGVTGDANNDMVVDVLDLNSVFNSLGITDELAGAVPEPATLALLIVGTLMLVRRRRLAARDAKDACRSGV